MPKRVKSVCRFTTCTTTHRNPSGYCDSHQQSKTNWHKWEAKKGTPTQRGYGAQWQKIRLRIKQRDKNLCQECLRNGRLTEAYAVDHIRPKSQGGSDTESNLECLCSPCHNSKTARERLR